MDAADRSGNPRLARFLLSRCGFLFLICAGAYNEFILSLVSRDHHLNETTVLKIRDSQIGFLVLGLGLVLSSEAVRRIGWLTRVFAGRWTTSLSVTFLVSLAPLFFFELALRPLATLVRTERTTIFVKDETLGWRLRPGAEGLWGDTPVKVNSKGLRGPEIEYTNPPDAFRILYLGDSVTFGYRLETYEQAFPHLTELALENELAVEIESVNAGVGGYSPWQELAYLRAEGFRYSPELVVVCFVLNDVTEKFHLIRYGGRSQGTQLDKTTSWPLLHRLREESSIVHFLGKLRARLRFGEDIQEGARREQVWNIQTMITDPDSAKVRRAWTMTLEYLGKIFETCKERGVPAVLVVFPYTFQFDDPRTLSGPQDILLEFAEQRTIRALDLLPILARRLESEGKSVEDYFLDDDHLSPLGNEVVAEILAGYLSSAGIVPGGSH